MKPVELPLPDLPEVSLRLGPAPAGPGEAAPPRRAMPWPLRVREALATYLPILLMAALALATWWLVKNSPRPPAEAVPRAVSADPDYTMSGFALERFAPDGRLLLRIEGAQLRHYPATDRIEIDGAQIQAWSPEGRLTRASAARAIGTGDGSELQLLGGAEVVGEDAAGRPLRMSSEFLHVFFIEERVETDRPVRVRVGGDELRAAGLAYRHASQRLELKGPLQVTLTPQAAR
ncbi:MAG: LPS export ABC transporter periplasmic protein LptC [Betaproteobacteria bacterium]|jgi:lipopolysaccharide export system protein LptC